MGNAEERAVTDAFPNTAYLQDIDLQTLAEDEVLFTRERSKRIPHVFIRPDDRTATTCPVYLRANAAGVSYLGLIHEYGSHEDKRPPQFSERIKIRVVSRVVKTIAAISEEELSRAYTSLESQASIVQYLETKYAGRSFSRLSPVTVYTIEYL